MTTIAVDLEALAERVRPHLTLLYGERAEEALDAVLEVCRRHGSGPRRSPRSWSAADTVLVAYPDHVRERGVAPLQALDRFLADTQMGGCFSLVHVLPFYPSTSDDGFSVVDPRAVDPAHGDWADIHALADRFELAADLVLNHRSRHSEWFAQFVRGEEPGVRCFHDVHPGADLSAVVRPRTSPVLTPFRTARGVRHVWTTFSDDQVDVNFAEPHVLADTVDVLLAYVAAGARVVRLDAVAFVWKEIGTPCIHHPNAHRIVKVLRAVVDAVAPGTWLLTETNVPHAENVRYWGRGDEAHLVYNFALSPLLLDALLTGDPTYLRRWLATLGAPPAGCTFLNFTASHDGVGVRPLESLLPRQRVAALVEAVERRGGLVSTRAGAGGVEVPYELNVTYFDALSDPSDPDSGDSARRFLLSQALALSVRGVPAVYLPSLVGARNDVAGVRRTGRARSINRHKYTRAELDTVIGTPSTGRHIFDEYRRLLMTRRSETAFHPDGEQHVVDLGCSGVLGFTRSNPVDRRTVLVAANVTAVPLTADLMAAGLVAAGPDLVSWRSAMGGRHLTLAPYEIAWMPVMASQRPSRPRPEARR